MPGVRRMALTRRGRWCRSGTCAGPSRGRCRWPAARRRGLARSIRRGALALQTHGSCSSGPKPFLGRRDGRPRLRNRPSIFRRQGGRSRKAVERRRGRDRAPDRGGLRRARQAGHLNGRLWTGSDLRASRSFAGETRRSNGGRSGDGTRVRVRPEPPGPTGTAPVPEALDASGQARKCARRSSTEIAGVLPGPHGSSHYFLVDPQGRPGMMRIRNLPFCPLFSRGYIHRQASGDVAEWSKALPC